MTDKISTPQQEVIVNSAIPSFQKIFESQASSTVVLSPQLVIQSVTDKFVSETGLSRDKLIGLNLFKALQQSTGTESAFIEAVNYSIQQVLVTAKPHGITEPLRLDIPSPDAVGEFIETYWRFSNTPVLDENGEVLVILFERVVANVLVKTRLQLKEIQEKEALYWSNNDQLRMDPLLRKVPMPVIILEGPDLIYADYNEASKQLFPEKPRLGKAILEAFPELEGQVITEMFRNTYQTGNSFEVKEILIPVSLKAGNPTQDFYWNIICQALYDANDKIVGLLVFALDVSSSVILRKQAEQNAEELKKINQTLEERVEVRTKELLVAYAETNQRIESYHSLFMQSPVGIAIYEGRNHIVKLANPFFCQLVGRTEDEVLHKSVFEAIPEVQGQGFEEILADVYENGSTFELKEVPATLEIDGKTHTGFYHVLYRPLRNLNNEIEGVLLVAYEVTQQVNARKNAENSAEKVLFMANAMPQKVWTANALGEVDYCNQQWIDYTGLSSEEFSGWGWKKIIEPEFLEENLRAWHHSLETGEMYQLEHRLMNKTGDYRWHLTRAVPHLNEMGEVTMWFGTSTDINDYKMAEQALQDLTLKLSCANESISKSNLDLGEMNQRLTHINSDLDNFIYTASHDLRAPIFNIERLLEELVLELPNECLELQEVKNITYMIGQAVDRFKKTINNLTDITRLQKDNKEDESQVNLREVVDGVKLDLQHTLTSADGKLIVDLKGCTSISFSEKNLRSVVYNLVSNAIKYRDLERQLEINISCQEVDGYTVLTVQDNGLGISSANQEKLFSMFKRFHDHVEGSGIGLFMVKRIVDNANGKIEVESKEGEGSTFRVYFRK